MQWPLMLMIGGKRNPVAWVETSWRNVNSHSHSDPHPGHVMGQGGEPGVKVRGRRFGGGKGVRSKERSQQ